MHKRFKKMQLMIQIKEIVTDSLETIVTDSLESKL